VNSYADPRTLTQKAYGKSLLFPPSIHSKWIQVKPLAITDEEIFWFQDFLWIQ